MSRVLSGAFFSRLANGTLAVAAVVLAAVLVLRFRPTQTPPTPLALQATGFRVPSLLVETLSGDTIDISQADSRLVILARTTCVICKANMPIYERIEGVDCGVRVALVFAEPMDSIRSFWSHLGWRHECQARIIGRALETRHFMAALPIPSTPTHYVLRRRVVTASHVGLLGPGDVRQLTRALISRNEADP